MKVVFLLVSLFAAIMFMMGASLCYSNLSMLFEDLNRYQIYNRLIDASVGLMLFLGSIIIWVLNHRMYYGPHLVKNPFPT